MFAFLILLLQKVMAILGFQSKNKANPKPEPGIDLEPGLQTGLRHRAPFTVEIHPFR